MRTIARHLLIEFALSASGVFLGLSFMWIAADVLLHVDDLAGHVAAGLREAALRAFPVLPIVLPLSGLAGAVLCLSRALRNRELTAIRTGGIRLQVALAPLLVLCALIAVGLGVLEDRVLLPLQAALERGREEDNGNGVRAPERLLKRWWFAAESSIFSAGDYEDGVLRDVTVFLFDEQRGIRERIDAKTAASLDGDTWEIHDAHVLEFSTDGIARHEVPALRLNLGITSGEMNRAAEPAAFAPLRELARQIRKSAGDAAELAKLELAAGAFWLCWTFALLAARSGAVPPALPVWGVTLGALALGFALYRRIPE